MKFRKKPVVIEATQWFTGAQIEGVEFTPCKLPRTDPDYPCMAQHNPFVRTLEGDMQVSEGDWIITGVKGERYPCKPDIFAATYEAVEQAGGGGGSLELPPNGHPLFELNVYLAMHIRDEEQWAKSDHLIRQGWAREKVAIEKAESASVAERNRRAPAPEQPAAQVNRLPGAVQNSEFCNGCGAQLLLGNLLVDDGCPCNTPRGVNITPQPCSLCRTDNCVKPAHAALGGSGQVVDEALYRSACDSVEEWKARALEAEHALERIRLDESPTFMGEPVLPEQPAAQGDGVPEPRDAHFGGNSYEASLLRNLLAVIHGDGGHYVAEHGIDKATEDAETKVAAAIQRQPADADRVDAERYRALRNLPELCLGVHGIPCIAIPFSSNSGNYVTGEEADAAIDSARAEGGSTEQARSGEGE